MLRLIENLTLGRGAVAYLTESMTVQAAAGAAVLIGRLANLEEKKRVCEEPRPSQQPGEQSTAAIRAGLKKVRAPDSA